MTELLNYLNGKDIAVIGNAKSIFNTPHMIDKHEVIIRMNKGNPRGKEIFLGTRTDILALSLELTESEIVTNFKPKFILWCTPLNRNILNSYLTENANFYPEINWRVLKRTLGARPSTGCMVLDFLTNYIEFESLNLYGFDFMETETWYTDKKHSGQHNYEAEKQYLTFSQISDKRIIFHS